MEGLSPRDERILTTSILNSLNEMVGGDEKVLVYRY